MMTIAHSYDCITKRSHVDMRDYCECGVAEIQARLDQLEEERDAVQRLIANAETITIENGGAPYTPKMVHAQDLIDVLNGKLR